MLPRHPQPLPVLIRCLYLPVGKLIAVSLLDSTVKVFFTDSLKFFLSLYGHKLPVLSMDVSSDSTLLVTGSADKNIKIWGLDFGDCHKSLFAHADSVMQVAFVPNTHYVFSVGECPCWVLSCCYWCSGCLQALDVRSLRIKMEMQWSCTKPRLGQDSGCLLQRAQGKQEATALNRTSSACLCAATG